MQDDLINCPVCRGEGRVLRSELLRLLRENEIHALIESCVAHNKDRADTEAEATVAGRKQASDFETQAHKWNPNDVLWRRSPKE
jgi:hypothetical protein